MGDIILGAIIVIVVVGYYFFEFYDGFLKYRSYYDLHSIRYDLKDIATTTEEIKEIQKTKRSGISKAERKRVIYDKCGNPVATEHLIVTDEDLRGVEI